MSQQGIGVVHSSEEAVGNYSYPAWEAGGLQQTAKGPQPYDTENAEMRKHGSENGVGWKVVQIVLPLFDSARDTPSPSEDNRDCASGAATPVEERKERKRKWYSLIDKVYSLENLSSAWRHVQSNKGAGGVDGQTLDQFAANAEANLAALHEQLKSGTYRPRPVRRVEIPKPGGGKRQLGIPCIRDRVVQQAAAQVLGPIFEKIFSNRSHGFRPERGVQTALEIVEKALKHNYNWTAEADISKFFDNVDHDLLMEIVAEEIADGKVLRLIRQFLESGVMLQGGEIDPTEVGTPQGGPLSPLLANIFLDKLDKAMENAGIGMIRYADDFVIFAKQRDKAEEGLRIAREVIEGLKLQLHPEKTRIAYIDDGFDFLGYCYFRDGKGQLQKRLSRKAEKHFRDKIRERTPRHAGQKRRKVSKCTLKRLKRNKHITRMIREVADCLRDCRNQFEQVRVTWEHYFSSFDRFVRQRLRNVMAGRYAKGRWHRIFKNKLFDELGLPRLKEWTHAPPLP